MMSAAEEDSEFRDLLAQTLEKNGCLAKLRAELRASIFLALEEDIKIREQEPLKNLRVQSYLENPEGRIMFLLVREFLEFFNLQFTISVYEPESYLDSIGQYGGRQKLAREVGLNDEEPTVPLLQQLIIFAQKESKVLDINLNLNKGVCKEDLLNNDSSSKKTDFCNSNSNGSQDSSNRSGSLDNGKLNTTFDINSPNVVNINKMTNNRHQDDLYNSLLNKHVIEEKSDLKATILEEPNKSLEKSGNFNSTYDLSSPTFSLNHINDRKILNEASIPVPKQLKDIREDDTYEDTSSIAEDSEALDNITNVDNEAPLIKNPSNSTISDNLSSNKPETDKPTLSLKSRSSLSSLSDLPPLPLNKTRVNSDNILPSLYNKNLKNKSNLKDLDKMFEIESEYEEDFINSNDISQNTPTVTSNQSKTSMAEENLLNFINKTDSKSTSKVISEVSEPTLKSTETDCSNVIIKASEHNNKSSIAEYFATNSTNSAQ